jgi:hypothetical protein
MGKAISYPPSRHSRFIVGRDRQGRWVVCDRKGLIGGLFADRESAVHFAVLESNHVPGAVCCAPENAVVTLAGLYETGASARQPRNSQHL